jgi:hypothetical protein
LNAWLPVPALVQAGRKPKKEGHTSPITPITGG